MAKFKYFEPADLAEALTLLKDYGDEARVIAGGQSLLILIRQGLIRPQVLISLHRIAALEEINVEERHVSLGAMATQRRISSDGRIRSRLPALAEAASRVGSIHVQNLGTVGGNISHAEPNGDSAPALICLGGSVVASSHRGERTIALDDFFAARSRIRWSPTSWWREYLCLCPPMALPVFTSSMFSARWIGPPSVSASN